MGTEKSHGPLATLVGRLLRTRPPRLTLLAAALDADGLAEFIFLVKEFLPDREKNIMKAGAPPEMVSAFALAFKGRYFPRALGLGGDRLPGSLRQPRKGSPGLREYRSEN